MPRPRPRHRRRALIGALLAATAPLSAVDLPFADVPIFDGPNPHPIGPHQQAWSDGFIVRIGERRLIGDALIFDLKQHDLYATGNVVYAMPGLRLEADRIGLHLDDRTGDAWNVRAEVETPRGPLPISAERVTLSPRLVEFYGVRSGPRHGGMLSLGSRRVRIHLREETKETRTGPARHVEGVTFMGTWVRVAGVPVLWLPALYRDFTIDYPWTRYEFGHSGRLGNFVRGWIGTDLPEFFGTRLGVQGRIDHHTDTGDGYGAEVRWRNAAFGRGLFAWYGMRKETVIDADGDPVDRRQSDVFDAEHRWSRNDGDLTTALYARWVTLPDQDPLGPGETEPVPSERFRADYLRDDLEHRPFARRGATGVATMPFGSLAIDTERQPLQTPDSVDRLWGAQLVVPTLQIVGPLHADADGWIESLDRDATDDQAVRLTHVTALRAMQWFGGFGLDGEAGARGLHYGERVEAGIDQDDDIHRYVPFAGSGARLRFTGRWGTLAHDLVPRIGVELYDRAYGDGLPPVRYPDPRDDLIEDRRYWTAGLATTLRGARELVRIEGVARFALRDQDRVAIDDDGTVHTAPDDFVELELRAMASPVAVVRLSGDALYDARLDRWIRADSVVSWRAHRHLTLANTTTILPIDGERTDVWQTTPGVIVHGGRYDLEGSASFKPGGQAVDRWTAELTRRMVDGIIAIGYELVRDDEGGIYDQRTTFRITIP